MRWERDQGGVSLFVESAPAYDKVIAATIPPSVVLVFGLLATWCGLAWAGPVLVFLGLAMWISVPLALQPSAHLVRTLRLDHRGVRIDDQCLAAGVEPVSTENGLVLGTRYLPVHDPAERAEILDLIRRANIDRTGVVPAQLAALRECASSGRPQNG